MKAKLASAILLLVLVLFPRQATGDAGQWSIDFAAAFASGEETAFGTHRPAPIAIGIAKRVGEAEFASLSPEEAAGLALELTISADSDIRGGMTSQEARLRSVQQARLLMKDRVADRDGEADRMRKMRSRLSSESSRERSGGLADPNRAGSASAGRGSSGPRKQ